MHILMRLLLTLAIAALAFISAASSVSARPAAAAQHSHGYVLSAQWTVTLTSQQPIVAVGANAHLEATVRHNGQEVDVATFKDLMVIAQTKPKRKTLTTCASGDVCDAQPFCSCRKVHIFRAFLQDAKRHTIARSPAVSVEWRAIQTITLTPNSSTLLMGQPVTLTAQAVGTPGPAWHKIEITELPSRTGTALGPARDCIIQPNNRCVARALADQAGTYQFRASVLDQNGKTVKSADISVTWSLWQVTLAPDAAIQTGPGAYSFKLNAPVVLHAHIVQTVPGAHFYLTLARADTGALLAAPNGNCPNQPDCTFTVPAQQGSVALRAGVQPTGQFLRPIHGSLGASSPLSLTWGATCTTCRQLTASLKTPAGTKVGAGTKLDITAQADQDLRPSFGHIVIMDDRGQQFTCESDINTCTWSVLQTSPAVRTYTTWVANPQGDKAGPTSNPLTITWDAWKILSVQPPTQSLTVGQTVAVIAGANYDLPPGYTIRIRDDSGASFSCTAGLTCTWNVKEDTAGVHTFSADVLDPSGTKVDVPPAPSTQITWVPAAPTWNGTVTLAVDRQRVPIGVTALLTATASMPVDGTGFKIVIAYDANNSTSCTTGATCTWKVTAPDAGTRAFSAWVEDANGKKAAVAPNVAQVTWFAWQVSLSADHTSLPVNQDVTLTATANFDVSGTGFVIQIIADTQDSKTCADGTTCLWSIHSTTPATHQFFAVVMDSSNTVVARSPDPPVQVDWQNPWTVTLQVDNSTPTVGSSVHFTVTVNMDWTNTNYIVKLQRDNGNGYVLDGCATPEVQLSCTFQVDYQLMANEPDTGNTRTYVATLQVKGQLGNDVAISTAVTVNWQPIPWLRGSSDGPSRPVTNMGIFASRRAATKGSGWMGDTRRVALLRR